jgi:hypothetical protein
VLVSCRDLAAVICFGLSDEEAASETLLGAQKQNQLLLIDEDSGKQNRCWMGKKK